MMAARNSLAVTIKIDGLQAKLAEFKTLGDHKKIGEKYLRDASGRIAQDMVGWTKSAAVGHGRQAAKFAPYIKVRRDRVPVVAVSPTGRIWKGRKDGTMRESFRALAGAEFGGRGHGFLPHNGRVGSWFFPTADAHQSEVAQRWTEAANRIIDDVNNGTIA